MQILCSLAAFRYIKCDREIRLTQFTNFSVNWRINFGMFVNLLISNENQDENNLKTEILLFIDYLKFSTVA